MDSVHSLVRIWFSEKGGGPLWEKDELLPQVEELKYLRILITNEGREETMIDQQAKDTVDGYHFNPYRNTKISHTYGYRYEGVHMLLHPHTG